MKRTLALLSFIFIPIALTQCGSCCDVGQVVEKTVDKEDPDPTIEPPYCDSHSGEIPSGAGTESDPMTICTAGHLQLIDSYTTQHFKLMTDIDLANTAWTPLGTQNSFSGTLDGNNKKIKNVSISSGGEAGFFLTVASTGVIKNLTIENLNITQGSRTGGFAATLSGTLENCHIKGTSTIANTGEAGGLAGLTNGGTITRSSVEGLTINSASNNTGGLVGRTTGASTISRSWIKSTTLNGTGANISFGGIVGITHTGATTITNVYVLDSILITDHLLGGIVGQKNAGGSLTLSNCYVAVSEISYATAPGSIEGIIGNGSTSSACYWSQISTNTTLNDPAKEKPATDFNDSGTVSGWGWDVTSIWKVNATGFPELR